MQARWFLESLAAVLTVVVVSACSRCEDEQPTAEAPSEPPAEPAVEPIEPLEPLDVNMDKVLLGRKLFHDTKLSGDGTLSCASCHSLDHGGAEPRRTSLGIGGQEGPINAPTVLNAALNFKQFWDGRAADLPEQAAGPVTNPIEMGATWEQVLENLKGDPEYPAEFAAIYDDGISETNVTDAIAEYERYLITPGPFDRYLKGDADAISLEAREGYELFKSIGCTSCHTGPNVGGTMFQKMGLVRDYFSDRGDLTDVDLGRFNVTGVETDRHFFKVPTLRNVALTGPYLHDGSRESLEEVVRVMGRYQLGRDLTDEQAASIVAFLNTLTGELPEHARMPEEEQAEGEGEGVTAPSSAVAPEE